MIGLFLHKFEPNITLKIFMRLCKKLLHAIIICITRTMVILFKIVFNFCNHHFLFAKTKAQQYIKDFDMNCKMHQTCDHNFWSTN